MTDRALPALLASGLLAVTPAAAQDGSGSPIIDRCRDVPTAEARIACLEAAILALTGPATPPVDDSAVAVRSVPVSGEAAPGPDRGMAASAPQAASPEDAADSQPGATAGVDEPVATVPAPGSDTRQDDAAVVAVADDVLAESASTIGAEQVDARTQTRQERLESLEEAKGLKVEEFETVGYQQLQVRLENGQIWRQIRGDVQRIRVDVSRNPTVDIAESSLGGYRMYLTGINRIVRVRRVR